MSTTLIINLVSVGFALSVYGGTWGKYRMPGAERIHPTLERLALLGRVFMILATLLALSKVSTGFIAVILLTSALHSVAIYLRFRVLMLKGNKLFQLSRYKLSDSDLWAIDESRPSTIAGWVTFVCGLLSLIIIFNALRP